MSESSSPEPSAASLFAAIEASDAARIADVIVSQFFTLFDVTDDSTEDEFGALTAEMEDVPVLVAFTSEGHAADFAGAMPDLFEADGAVPGFIVDGGTLLTHLPEEFGVLLNPETDDCYFLPPDLVDAVAGRMSGE